MKLQNKKFARVAVAGPSETDLNSCALIWCVEEIPARQLHKRVCGAVRNGPNRLAPRVRIVGEYWLVGVVCLHCAVNEPQQEHEN